MRRSCASPARTCRCLTPPTSKRWRCRSLTTSSRLPKTSAIAERSAKDSQLMPTQILMPALSPTMTEGKLAKWLKRKGDGVKSGDVIAEIETDKATMEMEAVDDGV